MFTRRRLLAVTAAIAFSSPAVAQQAKLPVVASFSILGDIVQNLGGDRIVLTTLVKPGSDAHVYSPTPADARSVAEARLVITNGLKFDGWMKRLAQSSASKAEIIEAAKGVKGRAEKAEAHGHSHDTAKKDKHGHDHAGLDPHAWQSVTNVKLYVATIRDALIAADPAGKAEYEANALRYSGELDALETEIKSVVAKIPAERRKIITSHDAFGYFQDAYGIRFIAPRGVSTEAEASAKDVARIIQQIKREKISAVFIENISDQRLMQQIAKDSGATIGGVLFSDSLSVADGPAPSYIRMMRHNIRVISDALVPKA
jgi:zinc/manganese transport system substrate-binding protein